MCVRACNALVLKLDYLSTTVCQKLHFLLSDAILRILSRASCACPRTLRVSAHISREDTQDGVSVGGFKMAAMSPVQLYIGQWAYALSLSGLLTTFRHHFVQRPHAQCKFNCFNPTARACYVTFARQYNNVHALV